MIFLRFPPIFPIGSQKGPPFSPFIGSLACASAQPDEDIREGQEIQATLHQRAVAEVMVDTPAGATIVEITANKALIRASWAFWEGLGIK